MAEHKSFQGKKNFNSWSTSSFIFGIPSLYYKAKALKKGFNRDEAAKKLLEFCHERKIEKTIDGVPLNKTNVILAMKDIMI